MGGVRVLAEVEGLAERAARLAEHLEALAVEFRFGRKLMRDVEQHDLLQAHARAPAIDHAGAADCAAPLAHKLYMRRARVVAYAHDSAGSARDCTPVEALDHSAPRARDGRPRRRERRHEREAEEFPPCDSVRHHVK